MRKLPDRLTIEMTSLFPKEICYVIDGKGTANGGFRRGFKTHAEMLTWLQKNKYNQKPHGMVHP